MIATVEENGNDLGNLALTTGSLTFRDLNNTDYRRDMSGGLTSSAGLSEGLDFTKYTTSLQYKNTLSSLIAKTKRSRHWDKVRSVSRTTASSSS
ncbi:hypothetical protein PSSHI_12690 [Photobacterium sp. R1]